MLAAARDGDVRSALLRAAYDGQPGHPVVLGRDHWAGVSAVADGDRGARDYLSAQAVRLVECADIGSGMDVDHPPGAADGVPSMPPDGRTAMRASASGTANPSGCVRVPRIPAVGIRCAGTERESPTGQAPPPVPTAPSGVRSRPDASTRTRLLDHHADRGTAFRDRGRGVDDGGRAGRWGDHRVRRGRVHGRSVGGRPVRQCHVRRARRRDHRRCQQPGRLARSARCRTGRSWSTSAGRSR